MKFDLDGYVVVCASHDDRWFLDENLREARDYAIRHMGAIYRCQQIED